MLIMPNYLLLLFLLFFVAFIFIFLKHQYKEKKEKAFDKILDPFNNIVLIKLFVFFKNIYR